MAVNSDGLLDRTIAQRDAVPSTIQANSNAISPEDQRYQIFEQVADLIRKNNAEAGISMSVETLGNMISKDLGSYASAYGELKGIVKDSYGVYNYSGSASLAAANAAKQLTYFADGQLMSLEIPVVGPALVAGHKDLGAIIGGSAKIISTYTQTR